MAYLDDRIAGLTTIPDGVVSAVGPLREELFTALVSILARLDQADGNVAATRENMLIIEQLISGLGNFLFESESQYLAGVRDLVAGVGSQAALANDFFAANVPGFKTGGLHQAVLEAQQFRVAQLFSRPSIEAVVAPEIRATLTGQIAAGGTFSGLVDSLREIIVGDAEGISQGRLLSYVKTWATTALATSDRQYVRAVSVDLDINRQMYTGNLVKGSRDFCKARKGKVFTDDEIRSWASQDWQGKIIGTNEETIFSFLGGYNCIDVLMPVFS